MQGVVSYPEGVDHDRPSNRRPAEGALLFPLCGGYIERPRPGQTLLRSAYEGPCSILITLVSGWCLTLESRSSASITHQSIFWMKFCHRNWIDLAGSLRPIKASGLWSCRVRCRISLWPTPVWAALGRLPKWYLRRAAFA